MNMKYSYPTSNVLKYFGQNVHVCISGIFTFYCFFTMKKILSKNCKETFFYQNCVYSGENTFLHYSQITVVHIHVNIFSRKFTQPARVTQTESN